VLITCVDYMCRLHVLIKCVDYMCRFAVVDGP